MEYAKHYVVKLTNVSETLLVPLYFKAKETIEKGVVDDESAVKIVRYLNYDFSRMQSDIATQWVIRSRTCVLDQIAREYVSHTVYPVIVNLGAGLDTRASRLKAAKWYQLDLKLPIELRRVFFNDSNLIAKSFLDFSWINDVEERDGVLFIIEGALMYMEEQQVKGLLRVIGNHFTHSLVAFDTIPKSYVNLRKHQSINMDTAPFKWGNYSAREVERWHLGLHAFRTFHYGFSFNLRAYYGFKVLLMKCD